MKTLAIVSSPKNLYQGFFFFLGSSIELTVTVEGGGGWGQEEWAEGVVYGGKLTLITGLSHTFACNWSFSDKRG